MNKNFDQGRSITLEIDGQVFNEWLKAKVTRDLNNFAGTFQFECRDQIRSHQTFAYASQTPPAYQLRPGAAVRILIDKELVLVGFIENVNVDIDEDNNASVQISGKDKAGDLVDCAAAPEGPVEINNIKLEDAAKKIAEPYGLTVRNEVDTGEAFSRYSIDLTETGLSSLEKAARQRQVLLLSDGVGGLVITRTGANRAPDNLTLPGNVKSSSGTFTHKERYSKTIVRGQGEKAAGKRSGALDGTAEPLMSRTAKSSSALTAGGTPIKPENRKAGDGSATQMERKGTAATGIAYDREIKRHRPKVHLARTKANDDDCKREAHWRSRSRRGNSEEMRYKVKGFRANDKLWRVNEMAFVDDHYQDIARDMLIKRVSFSEDDNGKETELTIISPEAFDNQAVKGRRKNKGKKGKGKKKGSSGPLDGSAEAL